ncbi:MULTISPECIES: carbohydrate ABC transporter permease [Kribbella]|jgi:multiple sugar transport system permease protein|uniref:Multiple sugar transport system permease protein n=1 Tax=Kribbella pratensis TaxID=2512112 RepID=A0ABY2FPX8_9ACTN|nr:MULTISPECIES: sugar ABC transporter permease [Kribbella]TDW94988.1 multiple sugar transport system permease protein [Kribbella pratensis]TDX03599.1 multiple sugar transport system permease protein [Kribbella sp. VKM Ac-2566]
MPSSGAELLRRLRNGVPAVLFALPVLLIFLVFSWGPIVKGLVMSVQQTNLIDPVKWVGLENFRYVLTDPAVGQASLNTLWFTLLALLFGFPVPVLLAMFLSELRGRSWLYTMLAYLPVITPPVVAILLWRFFYDPSPNGMFNTILGHVGLGPFLWLDSPGSAMPSIVLEATWAGAGNAVIIYLAALTSVRADLYEAAELDGAGVVRRVWHVMLPHLRSVLLLMLLLQVIGTMQLFTEPLLFTGGGPQGSTMTILLLIYNYAFVNGDYGAATALSVLLALGLAVLSAVFQLATRGWSTE